MDIKIDEAIIQDAKNIYENSEHGIKKSLELAKAMRKDLEGDLDVRNNTDREYRC